MTGDCADHRHEDRKAALRGEIDRLRLELHRANVQLERRDRLRRLRDTARARRAALVQAYFDARAAVLRRFRRREGTDKQAPATPCAPYEVCPLHPPDAVRARVLHVIANFHTGGSARLVVDLIEHLGDRFDHRVVARDVPSIPAYTGLNIRHVSTSSRYRLRRLLRSCRPDIVHVHYVAHRGDEWALSDWRWYSVIFDAVRATGCEVVENVNIPVVPFFDDSVRCYVHVSEYVQSEFGHGAHRNVTIYPGSDLTFFSRKPGAAVADDCIGMIYRLDGDKVNQDAIDVFIEVVRRRPVTRALIVGGGHHLEEYRARVERAGLRDAFSFPGYVSYYDLPAQLERMSVFIAPVHAESFGQVGPFAMGMELPVAGYHVGALPEITGNTSLLAPPGDHVRLADIIVELLDDRARRLRIGKENRQRAEQKFSVEAMASSYRALYETILRERLTAPLPAGRGRRPHLTRKPCTF